MRADLFVLARCVFVASSASAQPVSSPAALQSRIKNGDTVYVLDSMSREVTGVLGRVSDTAITIMVDGQLRDIPFSNVRRAHPRFGWSESGLHDRRRGTNR